MRGMGYTPNFNSGAEYNVDCNGACVNNGCSVFDNCKIF
jgi:hypothetical protein